MRRLPRPIPASTLMTKIQLACALVTLAGTLAGCATVWPPERERTQQTGPGPCKAEICDITVNVSDLCEITVDDPEKIVPRETTRPTLRFRLAPGLAYRWTFTEDGILFKNDPGGQMRVLGRSFWGTEFNVIDINDAPGRFEYRVRVTRRFGDACPVKDPFIVNN